MKFLKIFLSILVIVSIFIIGFFTYYVSDYVLPWDRAEVINTVQSWGGLSDLPKDATNFEYKKEGSIFTREFTVEFDAPKSEIENWILKSKGLQQKPSEIIKIFRSNTFQLFFTFGPAFRCNLSLRAKRSNP